MIADLVMHRGTSVSNEGSNRRLLHPPGTNFSVDRDGAMPHARVVIDTMAVYLLPGIIDTHVHPRERGKIEQKVGQAAREQRPPRVLLY
jgi:hypothetical protein